RTAAFDSMMSSDGHCQQPCDRVAAVVPAVTGTVLHDNVTGFERDIDAVVELEADRAFEHDVVVDRRRTMHPGLVGVGPWHERVADESMELVALRCQLEDRECASAGKREGARHHRLAAV